MNNIPASAAQSLKGLILKEKWLVKEKIEPEKGYTGGFFSVSYIVANGDEEAFLKALDFMAFFQLFQGRPIVDIINEQTNAYKYERDLLLRCKNKHLSKIAMILEEGQVTVQGHTIPDVPYLIFEKADGDVRSYMNFCKDVDISWKLRSLHDVAVGIQQLHSVKIGHQDLKPSNVLLYGPGLLSKICDLGRSLCADIQAPHENNGDFPGDINYAPPEFLYGFIDPDWNFRIRATDMYLFGSLVVFYFSGISMTALIGRNLAPDLLWTKWKGTFSNVKDYLIDAFHNAIRDFRSTISNEYLSSELSSIVEYCCFPVPEKRGHPKSLKLATDREGNRLTYRNQFDFQRVITRLDVLSKRVILQFN